MTTSKVPTTFWVIAAIAILWNIMGVFAFATDIMMSPETLATLSPEQQELYASNPAWMKIVYGIATITGLLGAIGLIMRKSWASKLFLVSLIAVILQMGYTIFATNAREVLGNNQALMFPIIVILIAAFLWFYARKGERRGWIS